jgi:ankyrin repeat protein
MLRADETQRLFTLVVQTFDSEEPGKFFEVLQSCVQQDPSLVTCKDAADITLLHYSAAKGCRASCEFLLVIPNAVRPTRKLRESRNFFANPHLLPQARGASKHARNAMGETPAADAQMFEHPELVPLLSDDLD